MTLKSCFDSIIDYLAEYFYDYTYTVDLDQEKEKEISVKYSALSETLLHIMSFITRASLVSDDDRINLKAYFLNNENFPTIDIIVTNKFNRKSTLGCMAGAQFSCMSLLSVYLLVKENNLALKIDQKRGEFIMTLSPFFFIAERG